MTFTASNSRIKVTDGTEVVLDTDENMPHIVGTQQVSNVYVGFPNASSYTAYWYTIAYTYIVNPPPTYQITSHYDMVYAGGMRAETGYYSSYYQPGSLYSYTYYTYTLVSGYDWSTGSMYFYYDLVAVTGYAYYADYYAPGYSYTYYVYDPPVYSFYFTYDVIYNPPYYETAYQDVYQYVFNSLDYDATDVIADLPVDEDGNAMSIDFIVVQASGTRTGGGTDFVTNQALLTTLPSGTFSFQGSVLLESAGDKDGSSWLRRIISVFTNNTTKKLVIRKQSSIAGKATQSGSSVSLASSFNLNFKIFYGRFKS